MKRLFFFLLSSSKLASNNLYIIMEQEGCRGIYRLSTDKVNCLRYAI